MGKAVKIKKDIKANEISGFLRELADTFDGQKEVFDVGMRKHIQDFSKIEIKIQKDVLVASVNMKMEQGEPLKPAQNFPISSQAVVLDRNKIC